MRTRSAALLAALGVLASSHGGRNGAAAVLPVVVDAFVPSTKGRARLLSSPSAAAIIGIGTRCYAKKAAAAEEARKKKKGSFGKSPPRGGVTLREFADVGKRIASGGGTVAVGGGSSSRPKSPTKPKPVAKKKPVGAAAAKTKTPVFNPLARKRPETIAGKNTSKKGGSLFGNATAKKPVVKKAAVAMKNNKKKATVKPFKIASGASASGGGGGIGKGVSFSDLLADFKSRDETEQQRLIGAGVAALLVGGLSLGGGGSGAGSSGGVDTAPPPPTPREPKAKAAPKPKPPPKAKKSKPAPVEKEVEVKPKEEKVVAAVTAPPPEPEPVPLPTPPPPPPPQEPIAEPVPVPVPEPPAPVVVRKTYYQSKAGKESFVPKLFEPIGGGSGGGSTTPTTREIRPTPAALTVEPWYKKTMDQYLSENEAEGDVAAKAPLIAAALLGLVATRSTMVSGKAVREQKQDAMEIIREVGEAGGDETEELINQLNVKISYFRDDEDLRSALVEVRDGLIEIQAKKKLMEDV